MNQHQQQQQPSNTSTNNTKNNFVLYRDTRHKPFNSINFTNNNTIITDEFELLSVICKSQAFNGKYLVVRRKNLNKQKHEQQQLYSMYVCSLDSHHNNNSNNSNNNKLKNNQNNNSNSNVFQYLLRAASSAHDDDGENGGDGLLSMFKTAIDHSNDNPFMIHIYAIIIVPSTSGSGNNKLYALCEPFTGFENYATASKSSSSASSADKLNANASELSYILQQQARLTVTAVRSYASELVLCFEHLQQVPILCGMQLFLKLNNVLVMGTAGNDTVDIDNSSCSGHLKLKMVEELVVYLMESFNCKQEQEVLCNKWIQSLYSTYSGSNSVHSMMDYPMIPPELLLNTIDRQQSNNEQQEQQVKEYNDHGVKLLMVPKLRVIDWWVLGHIVYEMSTGLPPFYDHEVTTMNEIQGMLNSQQTQVSKESVIVIAEQVNKLLSTQLVWNSENNKSKSNFLENQRKMYKESSSQHGLSKQFAQQMKEENVPLACTNVQKLVEQLLLLVTQQGCSAEEKLSSYIEEQGNNEQGENLSQQQKQEKLVNNVVSIPNAKKLRRHEFFKGVNWLHVAKWKQHMPIIPIIRQPHEYGYPPVEFTTEPAIDYSDNYGDDSEGRNPFDGFTYYAPPTGANQ